ncbi:MAG: putative membrane protein YedE/YeeE [Rhodothermales bacterium]|jgi:uncharacterized membrane protein YedE/YeeE
MNASNKSRRLGLYLLIGVYFGIVLSKSEAISWFRIQEMFRFQAFHMYGIIGVAVVVGLIAVQLIKRTRAKDLDGVEIHIQPKQLGAGTRYWLGGTIFGIGWALTGACPGPMFALIGNGIYVMIAALLAAVIGTWTYGALRPHLPH